MTDPTSELRFTSERIRALLRGLEGLTSGETDRRLEVSPLHDELDAIASGINVLAEELRRAHAWFADANFATAFRSNPCAMTITRLSDARFVDVNAGFERQTGYRRDEVMGRSIQEFGMWIDPDDLGAIAAALQDGGRLDSREVRFRTRGGRLATAVYSADIITFGDERCVLAVGLDVTDRKNTEMQAAALREELAHLGRVTMVDALTGSLAHEINQPLTAVMANAEAALRFLAAQPPRLRELGVTLNEIVNDNKRAGDVVQRMRTLLRKSPTLYEPVEVNSTVRDVVKLVQGNAAARRIALDVELGAGIDSVSGDRTQIQQVLLNLLLNAFDAVQTRDVIHRKVQVRTTRRDSEAVIEVTDQGAGLADEELALIFEPFFTTKRDGLGLGLSICRAIVGAHGGTLDAVRNPETGMTFSASFPICKRPGPDGTGPHAAARMQEQR